MDAECTAETPQDIRLDFLDRDIQADLGLWEVIFEEVRYFQTELNNESITDSEEIDELQENLEHARFNFLSHEKCLYNNIITYLSLASNLQRPIRLDYIRLKKALEEHMDYVDSVKKDV
jgi:hypothetical protein